MKWFTLILLLCGYGLGGNASAANPAANPNIVFLVADDLGWRDLGCYGSTFYETPHLDQLAREGARFNNAYAACPVCSPTRASLLTGKYPQRTGVTDYIGAAQPGKWDRNTKLLPAPYATELALSETTFAEALKAAGYATFFAGKWHLGPEGRWPEDQGFDVNKGGIDRGGPYGGKKYFSPYGNPRLEDGPEGEHLPDRLASEAAKFISANAKKPFLVYLPFYSVHTPLIAREDLRLKYEEKRKQMGTVPEAEKWGREGERDVRLVQDHAVYAAMVEAMDLAVGKVMAALESNGLADNTLVLFTSDNGGLSTSEGWPTSNAPLRGGKGWLYEGGIREPLIMRWPGKVQPGSLVETPVSSPDFMPTFLAAAGLKTPSGLDGQNLLPLFEAQTPPERALFWHYPHYGNQGGAPGAALRRGDWKLIEWFEDGRVELFNLADDPSEKNDLASEQSVRVKKFLEELHAWQKTVGAKFCATNVHFDLSKTSGRAARRPPETH